jgi:hypothetical protein
MLRKLRATRGIQLRDCDVSRTRYLSAQQAAQERLTHESAADNADAHANSSLCSPRSEDGCANAYER